LQLAEQEEEIQALKQTAELQKASLEASHSKAKLTEEEMSKLVVETEQLRKQESEFKDMQLKMEKLQWDLEIKDNEFKGTLNCALYDYSPPPYH